MARKKLNKNVVALATLFVFGCTIALSFLMLRQLQHRDPKHFVELAKQYANHEEWPQAALMYGKAYERSKDVRHIVSAGEMKLQEGDVRSAVLLWKEAQVEDPSQFEAHKRLVETFLEFAAVYGQDGDWRAVQDSAEDMLDLEESLDIADVAFANHAKGLALSKSSAIASEVAAGVELLRRAVMQSPERVEYSIDLAQAIAEEDRHDEAVELFLTLAGKHTTVGSGGDRVRLAYGKYLARPQESGEPTESFEKRWQQAGVVLSESIDLAADTESIYECKLALATYQTQAWLRKRITDPKLASKDDLFVSALRELEDSLESNERGFEAYIQMTTLLRLVKHYEDAIISCDKGIALGVSRKGIKGEWNRLLSFRLMLLGSQVGVDAAIAEDESLKASWLAKARTYLDQAAGEFPNHPHWLHQSGRLELAKGNERAALRDLRQAEDAFRARNTSDWANKTILAKLHLKLNEPGAAKAVLEDAIQGVQGRVPVPILLLYAQVLFQNGEYASPELTRSLAEVFLQEPQNTDAKRLQAALHEKQGRIQQAINLADSPSTAIALQAKEAMLGGDDVKAIEILRVGIEENPTDLRLIALMVMELLHRGETEEAREVVQRGLASVPGDEYLQRLEIAVNKEASEADRFEAMERLIRDEEDGFRRASGLAELYARDKQHEKALQYLRETEKHLVERDTDMALEATAAYHQAMLTAMLRVGHALNDDQAMSEAVESAKLANVDGVGGKTVLGVYHMLREENTLAISAFRDAVKVQTTDVATLTNLGVCLLRIGAADEAKNYFEQATRINASAALAQKGLAGIAAQEGDIEAFRGYLSVCTRLIPNDPWVREQVLWLEERDRPQQAILQREQRMEEDPGDVNNIVRLAALHERIGEQAEAQAYYARIVALKPDDRQVVLAATRFYRKAHQPKRALEIVTQFVALQEGETDQAEGRILVAAHYLSEGNLQKAEEVLLAAAAKAESFEVCRSLGEFYLRSVGDSTKSLPWIERAIVLADGDSEPMLSQVLALRIAGELLSESVDFASAQRHVDEFKQAFPNNHRPLLWEGQIRMRKGDTDAAEEAITAYLKLVPRDAYALYQRSQLEVLQGRLADAIADLLTIKHANPMALGLKPRIRLAQLYKLTRQTNAWLNELELLVESAPGMSLMHEQLIGAYLETSRFSDAQRLATVVLNKAGDDKGSARFYAMRGRALMGDGIFKDAIQDLQQFAELSDYTGESIAQVLDGYEAAGLVNEGLEYYRKHEPTAGMLSRSTSTYARLSASMGEKDLAVISFREAMNHAMKEALISVRMVSRDIRLSFPDTGQAIELFTQSQTSSSLARANEWILSRLYFAEGRAEDGLAKLDPLLRSATSDAERASLLVDKGDFLQRLERWSEAVEAYEKSLQYFPRNWVALNNLAYLLADKERDFATARLRAEQAVQLAENADTIDTLGWIRALQGDYEIASGLLDVALRLNPSLPIIYYHAGESLRRANRFTEAAETAQNGLDISESQEEDATRELLVECLNKSKRRESGL